MGNFNFQAEKFYRTIFVVELMPEEIEQKSAHFGGFINLPVGYILKH